MNTLTAPPVLSPTKTHLILPTPNNVLKCHDISSNTLHPTLQCTLRAAHQQATHQNPISSCTVLSPHLLCTQYTSSENEEMVNIFDIHRGAHCHTVTPPRNTHLIAALPQRQSLKPSSSTTGVPEADKFYIISHDHKKKCHVLEYAFVANADAKGGYQLQRKIKCGHLKEKKTSGGSSSILAVLSPTASAFCFVYGREFRVVSLENGERRLKEMLDEVMSGVFWCQAAGEEVGGGGTELIVFVGKESGTLFVYECSTGGDAVTLKCRLVNKAIGGASVTSVELSPGGELLLVNGTTVYNLKEETKMTELIVSDEKKMAILTGHFLSKDEIQVIMMQGSNTSDLTAEIVPLKTESGGEEWRSDAHITVGTSSKKRRGEDTTASSSPPDVLVSVGSEHLGTRELKKQKTAKDDPKMTDGDEDEDDNDDYELSLAERLRAMEDYSDTSSSDNDDDEPPSSSSSTKKSSSLPVVTTESLTTILTQSLTSNDEETLEHTLFSAEGTATNTSPLPESTIRATLLSLPNDELRIRLAEVLVKKMGRQPRRAAVWGLWMRLLVVTSVSLGREKVLLRVLAPLRNLIGERVEGLKDLMVLKGRLELVCSGV